MDLPANYPTPSSRDFRQGSEAPHGFGQRNLNDLAVQYPTPRAHDRLPGGGESEMNRHTPGLNAIAARYPTPTSSEDHARAHGESQASKCLGALAKDGPSAQLNPDWVEWLMGWPVGWTDPARAVTDWRDLSVEPDDIHISTTRRANRRARIKAIGNGQVPLCAAVAAESGFAFLEAVHHLQAASAATARGGLPATPGAGLSALADGFDRAGEISSTAPSRIDGQPQHRTNHEQANHT